MRLLVATTALAILGGLAGAQSVMEEVGLGTTDAGPPGATDAGPGDFADAGADSADAGGFDQADAGAEAFAATEAAEPTAGAELMRHSARGVAYAPLPGQASGQIRGDDQGGRWSLWVPRVLLFPVRVATEIVDYPIRKGLHAYEVYDLEHRIKAIFFNDAETFGLYPTVMYDNRSGPSGGARLVVRELGGSDFGLDGKASFSLHVRQSHALELDSRETWARARLLVGIEIERRPGDNFWGIGNDDFAEMPPAAPIDPIAGELVETEYRQDAVRGRIGIGYLLTRSLWLTLSDAVIRRDFQSSTFATNSEDIAVVFETDELTGFTEGALHNYSELELRYDSRRAPSRWLGQATPTTGVLASTYVGYHQALRSSSSSYGRYGAELQRPFGITAGPRVLTIRALMEGVTGSYDEVPFYDLPRLGGPLLLRGYEIDTFRDRFSVLGSAEYQFDLSSTFLSGFLFVDAGRVFPSIKDLRGKGIRVGYGGGVELHSTNTFYGRVTLASSSDGGVILTLSLDPVFDLDTRAERR